TVEQAAGLLDGQPLERIGHQRRGGGRNGTARALEGDIPDAAIREIQEDRDPVATERVVPLGPAGGAGERPEVAGPPVVIEDHLLVEVAQVAHPNSSRARRRAAARASTSSGVL